MRMSSRSQRSAIAGQRIAQVGAIGHFVDDDPELAADRIGHFDRQQVERRGDRVAGAKAADEHVERDRELVLHLLAHPRRTDLEEQHRNARAEHAARMVASRSRSGRRRAPRRSTTMNRTISDENHDRRDQQRQHQLPGRHRYAGRHQRLFEADRRTAR